MSKKITFLVILTLTFAAIYVVTYAERFSDDVWTLHLWDCDLDYHIPIRSIALACPGLHHIHPWPLPVEQPWQETPDPLPDPWPARFAWR